MISIIIIIFFKNIIIIIYDYYFIIYYIYKNYNFFRHMKMCMSGFWIAVVVEVVATEKISGCMLAKGLRAKTTALEAP